MTDDEPQLNGRAVLAYFVYIAAYTLAALLCMLGLMSLLAYIALATVGAFGLNGLAAIAIVGAVVVLAIGTTAGWYATRLQNTTGGVQFDGEDWGDLE